MVPIVIVWAVVVVADPVPPEFAHRAAPEVRVPKPTLALSLEKVSVGATVAVIATGVFDATTTAPVALLPLLSLIVNCDELTELDLLVIVPVPAAVVPLIVRVMVGFEPDAVNPVEVGKTVKVSVVVLMVTQTLFAPEVVQVGAVPLTVLTARIVREVPSLKEKSDVCQLLIALSVKSASVKSYVMELPVVNVVPPTSVNVIVCVAVVFTASVESVSLTPVSCAAVATNGLNPNVLAASIARIEKRLVIFLIIKNTTIKLTRPVPRGVLTK